MLRKIRFIFVLLCFLLIFSPMTEIWARAEESGQSVPGEASQPEEKTAPIESGESGLTPICQEPIEPDLGPGLSDSKPVQEDSDVGEGKTNGSTEEEIKNPPNEGTETMPPIAVEEQAPPEDGEINCLDSEHPSIMDSGHQKAIIVPTAIFTDVSSTYWAFSNINHLSSQGVIKGYENGDGTLSFQPEQKVTRAQAAKMIIEAIGEREASVSSQIFSDVPVRYWAAGYIQRAYELGIFKGYEDGSFGPTDTLKRSQMAKVIAEAYNFDFNGYNPSTPVFYDVTTRYWAYDYIEKLHYNGISNGSNYQFLPEDLISRAQFSAFLSRAMDPGFRLKVTGPVTTKGKVISKTALNIRAEASDSAEIVGEMTPGTFVNILEFNGYWAKVNYEGITGYAHKSYMKLYSSDSSFPLKDRIIVLDAGHGARDPGTTYQTTYEKDIVLSISKKVADRLRATGAKVIMTRETDKFLSLEERVEFTKQVYGEMFISFHVNAVKDAPTAHGTEIYFNTSYNMNGTESRVLAAEIQRQIVAKANMYDRGIKDSGFYVIKHNQIPAVLIEHGFLTNIEDRSKLTSDQYQNLFAEAIYQGIRNYYLK